MRLNHDIVIPEGTHLKPLREGQPDAIYVGVATRSKRIESKNEELHVYWTQPVKGTDGREFARRLRIVDRASLLKGYQVEQYIRKDDPRTENEKLREENAKLKQNLSTFEARLARLDKKGVTLVPGDPLAAVRKEP